jgi:hypothetical protein
MRARVGNYRARSGVVCMLDVNYRRGFEEFPYLSGFSWIDFFKWESDSFFQDVGEEWLCSPAFH